MTELRGKKITKDRGGVSPVIAIILMVAITIVLAGVLWLWVASLVVTDKDPIDPVMAKYDGRNEQNDFVLVLTKADGPKGRMSVNALRFKLLDGNKVDRSGGQHRVNNVYGKPIDDQTVVSFRDGDHNGELSVGDRFIIKSRDHVDADGTSSPGEAVAGYTFELYSSGQLILEMELGV